MSVTLSRLGQASVVTLSWSHKRNSLDPDDADEVTDALERAAATDCSAVVLTGEGAFCAGGDLRAFAELSGKATPAQIRDTVYTRVQSMIRALSTCPQPTIAAVDGAAVGLGFDLALACDMRFIGPHGWFRQGWAAAGLIPGTGGIGLLRRLAPSALWPLVASQAKVTAAEAVSLGLAEPSGTTALEAAISRTEQLSSIPAEVLQHYVTLSRADSWPRSEHFTDAADVQAGLIGSARFRDFADRVLCATESSETTG